MYNPSAVGLCAGTTLGAVSFTLKLFNIWLHKRLIWLNSYDVIFAAPQIPINRAWTLSHRSWVCGDRHMGRPSNHCYYFDAYLGIVPFWTLYQPAVVLWCKHLMVYTPDCATQSLSQTNR
jgi:hypothetical protein